MSGRHGFLCWFWILVSGWVIDQGCSSEFVFMTIFGPDTPRDEMNVPVANANGLRGPAAEFMLMIFIGVCFECDIMHMIALPGGNRFSRCQCKAVAVAVATDLCGKRAAQQLMDMPSFPAFFITGMRHWTSPHIKFSDNHHCPLYFMRRKIDR